MAQKARGTDRLRKPGHRSQGTVGDRGTRRIVLPLGKPLVATLTEIAKLAGHLAAMSEHGGASRKKTAELSQHYLALPQAPATIMLSSAAGVGNRLAHIVGIRPDDDVHNPAVNW